MRGATVLATTSAAHRAGASERITAQVMGLLRTISPLGPTTRKGAPALRWAEEPVH